MNVDSSNLRLSFADSLARADVSLTNGARVDVTAGNGGSIAINAGNLNVSRGSRLKAGIASGSGSVDSQAGDTTLSATGVMTISQHSSINNDVGDGATGNAGDINIQAGSLLLTDLAYLNTTNEGQGDAGSVSVQANGNVSFVDSFIFNYALGEGDAGSASVQANGNTSFVRSNINSSTYGEGDAGSVSVQANGNTSFVLGGLSSSTSGEGDAGSVSVQANGNTSFADDSSNIDSSTYGEGKGGNIKIQARSVYITDGAELKAVTSGSGNAGNIQVDAIDSVTLSGVSLWGYSSGLFTATDDDASGQGGEITVRTGALRMLDGAVVSARTRGEGDGGNITVNVNTLEVTGGGQMLTTAYSNGDAGSITVNATGSTTLSGSDPTYFDRLAKFGGYTVDPASPASGIFTNTASSSSGQGGSLKIETGRLNVRNGGEVSVSSGGIGAVGDLTVSADSIGLDNQSSLRATTATGNQGNIILRSGDLVLRHGSTITTNATGTATGGNITIDTGVMAALENSDISASSSEGSGGRIRINAQGIFGTEFRTRQSPESDITASSNLGSEFSGTVEINTPDVDSSEGLVELPAELVDVSNQIAQTCSAGGGQGQSKFIVAGRGGLPPNSSEALSTEPVQVDWVTLNPRVENAKSPSVSSNPTTPEPAPLVEAQGWVTNALGEVVLTATAPSVMPNIPWLTPASCHAPQKLS